LAPTFPAPARENGSAQGPRKRGRRDSGRRRRARVGSAAMPPDTSATTLRRGGAAFDVAPAPSTFTVRLADAGDADRLRAGHLESRGGPALVAGADARVSEAWRLTKGSRSVVVAVLDDGFDLFHPDLRGPGKVVEPVDFTDGDRQPLPEGRDFHGTCCAGVA